MTSSLLSTSPPSLIHHSRQHSSPYLLPLRISKTPNFANPKPLRLTASQSHLRVAAAAAATLSSTATASSTRTVSTIFTISGVCLHFVLSRLPTPTSLLQPNLLHATGPLFFAAMRNYQSSLNTPLTVVAAGLAKWLDIYSGVLMVRVLLSWFPNIPWDRQPLSAIRDLCDPYLNLFRNIIPPVFDTLDVSPLLAFAVLGTLGSILSGARGV